LGQPFWEGGSGDDVLEGTAAYREVAVDGIAGGIAIGQDERLRLVFGLGIVEFVRLPARDQAEVLN
jgi:hypothetical protein